MEQRAWRIVGNDMEILNYFYNEVELGQVQDVVKNENP